MVLQGCQGKADITVEERTCPQCGHEIEIFSIDADATCENCGFVIYNDSLNCVQWCAYARQCVGDERYEQLMAIAKSQKERKQAAQEAAAHEAAEQEAAAQEAVKQEAGANEAAARKAAAQKAVKQE